MAGAHHSHLLDPDKEPTVAIVNTWLAWSTNETREHIPMF